MVNPRRKIRNKSRRKNRLYEILGFSCSVADNLTRLDVTQSWWGFVYRRPEITYQHHLQGSRSSRRSTGWPFKIIPEYCPKNTGNQMPTQLLTNDRMKTSQIGFAISSSSAYVREWSVTYPHTAGLSTDTNKASEELLGRLCTSPEGRLLKALPVMTTTGALAVPVGTHENHSCSRGSHR